MYLRSWVRCDCEAVHSCKRVVLTGGPGGGKTAILELIGHLFCPHVKVLPEAAGVVFGGGFPRERLPELQRAAQRAIFYVQRELEASAGVGNPAIVLCDRGTVDGVAYWPGSDSLFDEVGTTLDQQMGRYDVVIHLRTPRHVEDYNVDNPLRIETAVEAAAADDRIFAAWSRHPRRVVIDATPDFFAKVRQTIDVLRGLLPACCEHHVVSLPARPLVAPESLL
ncbi:MAG TPA: ATP-binding protein [Vicinamibacterales bacterium]|nr:ATP-binding protein [Vicinamibacterales bacterium]